MRKRCAQKAGRQPPYGTATEKFGATLKKQDAFVTELRTGFFQRQATFFKKKGANGKTPPPHRPD